MQQAGRAGRGAAACHRQSLAICVCFNGPVDQHLWRHPSSLLQKGVTASLSMPIYPGLVKGHLLCAGQEYPLTGKLNVTAIQSIEDPPKQRLLSDEALFGSAEIYEESLENLMSNGSICEGKLPIFGGRSVSVFKTHPSVKTPWTKVSIRSIENINYDIVDISHPMQANRMDGCHNEAAVLVSSRNKRRCTMSFFLNDFRALILC
jgi:DEAD/DEAH box helicase domain-containing protein